MTTLSFTKLCILFLNLNLVFFCIWASLRYEITVLFQCVSHYEFLVGVSIGRYVKKQIGC